MSTPFQLLGGHPVLDLVNTLDSRFVAPGPVELLPSYEDLLRFARQSRILSTHQARRLQDRARGSAAVRVLRGVHGLRESLATLFYAWVGDADSDAQALTRVERLVIEADSHRELISAPLASRTNAIGANWSWRSAENLPELPLWILSKSAEALLTSTDFSRISACQRDSCRWLYLDSSKNHSRRWCDMKLCGNRVKAQRFHAKHAR